MLSDINAQYVLREIIKLYPDAQPPLHFTNEFELLVAVMLSAQTTDKAVNKVTPALFEAYPTPLEMALASPKDIEPYIKTIGLYHNKARFLQACAQDLVEKHASQVPNTRKDLEALAGVGRKTANVVLSVAFNIPAVAVDTHVQRVCKHHLIVATNANTRQVEDRICHLLDPSEWTAAHHALIYFGREICTARNPKCHLYPQLFDYPDK